MVTVLFDDVTYEVDAGLTVLEAARSVGIEIPHYCYHPGLPIDGNCRMCLVEIDKMSKPAISCNTRVAEGMSVRIQTEKVAQMRKSVMEFLLLNHPLDCPECDQAGECRLQEYYMRYNRQASRLGDLAKVHKPKAVPIGPNVMFDAERCILCTRCVRFCNEISKTRELYIKNRGNRSEITTFPDRPLDNAYATCTVDICPVGALTSKDFRFKKRVWFLKSTDSICNGCATGCHVSIDHADDTVYRYRPRYNADVNQYWMCDEGRLSYKRLQDKRITEPFMRTVMGQSEAITRDAATVRIAGLLRKHDASNIAFIVSAQQTNDTLAAIARFRATLFSASPFYYTQRTVENPSSDDFLIHADKNPNTQGVEALADCRPLSEWQTGPRIVLAFDHLNAPDAALILGSGLELEALIGLVWQENPLSQSANLVCPIPNYWEESGSFTNKTGYIGHVDACFPPKGGAQPISAYLAQWQLAITA